MSLFLDLVVSSSVIVLVRNEKGPGLLRPFMLTDPTNNVP